MDSRLALVFPGQGSQHLGMGWDLWGQSPAARSVLVAADDTIGFGLSKLCFEGPEDLLRETSNAQPAILAVSLAALAALREAYGAEIPCRFVAGHSLGEISALAAARALRVEDAVRLVRTRGELMSAAARLRPGAMAAVLGLDDAAVEAVCLEASGADGVVVVANYNSAGQSVISGDDAAVQRAAGLAKAKGARRVVPLAVSGAFHSPLMESAVAPVREAVEATPMADPAVPVVGNVEARPIHTAAEARAELVRQIISPVRWARSVRYMVEQGATALVEVGPGQVLGGMAKRVPGLRTANVDSVASAQSLVKEWEATA